MKLDLNEVVSHLGKHVSYEINEPPIEDAESGLKCVEPIVGKATFSNTGRHVVVRGEFRTTVEIECARCLGSYRVPIQSPIEESFQIPGHIPDMAEEQEEEQIEDEESELLFQENMLDLTELLRQNILLALPIKPICSDECKGLCPTCGRNLNEGPCGCPQDTSGSAFAGLAFLLEETDEEKKE
jgi:uncharacterized protein